MTTIIENGKKYRISKYVTKNGEVKHYKKIIKRHSQQEHKPKCHNCHQAFHKAVIRTLDNPIQIGWYCRTCKRFYYLREINNNNNNK